MWTNLTGNMIRILDSIVKWQTHNITDRERARWSKLDQKRIRRETTLYEAQSKQMKTYCYKYDIIRNGPTNYRVQTDFFMGYFAGPRILSDVTQVVLEFNNIEQVMLYMWKIERARSYNQMTIRIGQPQQNRISRKFFSSRSIITIYAADMIIDHGYYEVTTQEPYFQDEMLPQIIIEEGELPPESEHEDID